MAEVEKVHFLTEAIYKNLLDNFSPGVKQLLSSGRAFQKSLHAVVNSSKAYVDCIYGLARGAQVCKGATSEIGAALLQIAEVHKEINTQVLDNIKTFHSELLIPLESCHENELKQMQTQHKKYLAGHKYHLTPYEKGQMALKKQKKKNKNKFGFDQKELQYSREVKECVIKLEEYHSNQLREALMEERQKYCGLLEKICTVVRNYASHHSKPCAHELLTHRLSEWSDLCRNPHILPESSELVVQAFRNAHQDNMYSTTDEMQDMRRRASLEYVRQGSNSGSNPGSNQDNDSLTYGTTHRMPSHDPYHSSPMPNGMLSQDDYAVAGLQRSITFHDSPSQTDRHKVRALYSHQVSGDNQLTFNEGDVVSLLGDPRDGWQYGECMRTRRMGWFPISFTQPLQTGSADAHVSVIPTLGLSGRVKSLGNLREVTDEDYQMQSGGPINSGYSDSDSGHGVEVGNKRPTSLYQHHPSNNEQNKFGGNDNPLNIIANQQSIATRDTPSPPLPPPPPPGNNPLVMHNHHNPQQQHHTHQSRDQSPSMPPPPPPLNTNPHHHHIPPHLHQQHYHLHHHAQNINKFIHSNTSPQMNTSGLHPPPSPMYEYHPRNSSNNNSRGGGANSTPQTPGAVKKGDYNNANIQLNSYSPANSSSGYSSNASSGYGGNNGGGGGGGGNSRHNTVSNYATTSYNPPGPADQLPPPPANLPPPPPASEDEDSRNNLFVNISLKKTKTHDRSAPRIK